MIVAKVFPLLITPCLCAWLIRYLAPKLHRKLLSYPDLAFYLWSVALTLAIAVTTKSIVHSKMSVGLILAMSLVSLVCCAIQFALGRYIGASYRPRCLSAKTHSDAVDMGKAVRKVTAGQSLGQKNTVFAIWLAYTFLTPETAIVGGLYSIWHNIYNSWQLRQQAKK
jgi:BASS family bile acid:Na+ symporter